MPTSSVGLHSYCTVFQAVFQLVFIDDPTNQLSAAILQSLLHMADALPAAVNVGRQPTAKYANFINTFANCSMLMSFKFLRLADL